MGKSKIINGRLITPYRIIEGAELTFEDGIITGIGNRTDDKGYETVDAGGCYVTPGFIDIHSHGGGGMDFMDEDPSVFDRISRNDDIPDPYIKQI